MSSTAQQVPVDDVKLQAFVGQAVSELGATLVQAGASEAGLGVITHGAACRGRST
jgi:hypothetical protein